MPNDDLNFWGELNQYIESGRVERIVFTLSSGEKILVDDLLKAVFGGSSVSIHDADGNITMFPASSVSSAEVLLLEE